MKSFAKKVWGLLLAEDGPTAVEYAVLLASVLLVVLAGVAMFGQATSACFEHSRDEINRFAR
jgi:pilus assembly protein Flp/PilA